MRVSTACIFALLAMQSVSASAAESKEVKAVRSFVQRFYDWYTPKASSDEHSVPTWYLAVDQKSSLLEPKLLKAIRQDIAAQKKATHDQEGLDFDPFMNSQDPDPRYAVGKIRKKGRYYYVSMRRVLEKTHRIAEVAVIAKVEKYMGSYRFADFIDPTEGWTLMGTLKELRKEYSKP